MIKKIHCQNCETLFDADIPENVAQTKVKCPMCNTDVTYTRVSGEDPSDEAINDIVRPVSPTSDSGHTTQKKRGILIGAVVILFVCVIGIIIFTMSGPRPKRGSSKSVYDVELGQGITLGQDMDTIAKVVGDYEKVYGRYEYRDGLEVSYTNGKATAITLSGMEPCWETGAGFTDETTIEDIQAVYGTPHIEDTSTIGYRFDNSGKPTDSYASYYVIYFFGPTGYGKDYALRAVMISNEFES